MSSLIRPQFYLFSGDPVVKLSPVSQTRPSRNIRNKGERTYATSFQ
jgi:hypothetical protein